ncbi:helix-turn-helix domain-containing protein [Luminiphilus sp.]|nr:helix-turn-helix domain-containing protein [Luminiphilus sp.]
MSDDNKVQLDKGKISTLLAADKRTKVKIAEDAGVDRKTLSKAERGETIRKLVADKLAQALNTEIGELLVAEERDLFADETIEVDLRACEIADGASTDTVYQTKTLKYMDQVDYAYPSASDHLVLDLSRAKLRGTIILKDAETGEVRPPLPYWTLNQNAPRGPRLTSALEALNKALELHRAAPLGANSLSGLLVNLETEGAVAGALEMLGEAGCQVLSTTVEVYLNDYDTADSGYPDWSLYTIPICVVAHKETLVAKIYYRTLVDVSDTEESSAPSKFDPGDIPF